MIPNLFLAQRLAELRIQEALHEAQQARATRAVKGAGGARRWWLPLTLTLSMLLGFIGRGNRLCR